jgi:hypothetical protein
MNVSPVQPHLNPDQFSTYVAGLTVDHSVSLHLDTCDACRGEVDRFRQSLASFSEIGLVWAETKSETGRKAIDRAQPRTTRPPFVWLPTAAWAAAAALAVTLGLSLSVGHRPAEATDQVALNSTAPMLSQPGSGSANAPDENSPAAIARDNALMLAVAQELDRADAAPAVLNAGPAQARTRPRGE